jgi:hypothetical protein
MCFAIPFYSFLLKELREGKPACPVHSIVKVQDNRVIVTLTETNGQDIQGLILITGEIEETFL